MNPHIKEEWVATLKGNKFLQIKGALRGGNNERCALGVLVELYIKYHPRRAGWAIRKDTAQYDLITSNGLGGWETHETKEILPEVVRKWAGLHDQNPYLSDGSSIPLMNDGGKTFSYIAQKIESSSL